MEGKWFEAGCSGNIDFLHDAVRGDGGILQKLYSRGTTDTPLHLASIPLHLALANGHLEIVQFLLEFGKHKFALKELCMKKDRDGRTALHSAGVTGKISVIDLLFDHCPDAPKEITIHQESVVHLAVKHHQQEVLEFLIDQKLGSTVQDFLNRGDRVGHTILHLVTAKKQLQVCST
ncbi:UNVERIFIED_CONTAM: hypothetical protein Sangu_1720500 [Sesamum angustifolium]|uniref:Uncharacterized protein n=1 Tax=Sesamum angustifolium TaxID=2727405 RepID=A0AAW2MM55_9LAMI